MKDDIRVILPKKASRIPPIKSKEQMSNITKALIQFLDQMKIGDILVFDIDQELSRPDDKKRYATVYFSRLITAKRHVRGQFVIRKRGDNIFVKKVS